MAQQEKKQARVLIIAGSDSGGGAGIQADIKTVTALGGYAATAITAITVQDTQKVYVVHQTPPDIIRQQINVVLSDIGADVIKIGMIGDLATAEIIEETLLKYPQLPVVLDPVLIATSGDGLATGDVANYIKKKLLPLTTVVTPNIPEAVALTGLEITSVLEQGAAGRALLSLGATAALVKGGHLQSDLLVDKLVTRDGSIQIKHDRLKTRNTHGTGCTLASALAVSLGQGMDLETAAKCAANYVYYAIKTAPSFGKGQGPLNHGWVLKR